jgi:hypothetical protein
MNRPGLVTLGSAKVASKKSLRYLIFIAFHIPFFLFKGTVVVTKNGGGLGGRLLFEDGFGPWRSMSVCFLILLSSFLQRISVSVL